MPKVKFNASILEIRGAIGDLVFKKSPQGELIVTKRPDMSKVKWSPAQKSQRLRFKAAARYAKQVLATPEVRLEYERMAKEQN